MRRVLSMSLVGVFLIACGDDPPPTPPPTDTNVRDAGSDSARDAGTDAGTDAESDAERDAAEDSTVDAPVRDVTFPDMGPGEPTIVCEEDTPEEACSDPCPDGSVCADEFCGGNSCVPGRQCTTDEHCGGRTCIRDEDAPPTVRGTCTPLTGACTTSSECALGFRCEESECVDRRIPCGFHESGCPRGYTCTFALVAGRLFCVPAHTACTTDGQCEDGGTCTDVDGDGDSECVPGGRCSSNDDCAEGTSCGIDPGTSQSACQADGACRDGGCPDGFECVNTGVAARCVAGGGSCELDAECDPQSVCGSVSPTDPLRCLTFDEDSE